MSGLWGTSGSVLFRYHGGRDDQVDRMVMFIGMMAIVLFLQWLMVVGWIRSIWWAFLPWTALWVAFFLADFYIWKHIDLRTEVSRVGLRTFPTDDLVAVSINDVETPNMGPTHRVLLVLKGTYRPRVLMVACRLSKEEKGVLRQRLVDSLPRLMLWHGKDRGEEMSLE